MFCLSILILTLSFVMDVRIKHPASILVSGPSGAGKSEFVFKLLQSDMFDTEFSDIILCYSEMQPGYARLKDLGVKFHEGIIEPDSLDPRFPHLVVLDDLMDSNDRRIEQFFTRSCHHRNTSCIYIVQNIFNQGKGHRTCSLNAHYIVYFKSPRDVSQIRVLEHQMFPGKKNFLVESYQDACNKPYQFLFLDLKADTPSHLRVRGDIFNPQGQAVYLPKDYKFSYSNGEESFQ